MGKTIEKAVVFPANFIKTSEFVELKHRVKNIVFIYDKRYAIDPIKLQFVTQLLQPTSFEINVDVMDKLLVDDDCLQGRCSKHLCEEYMLCSVDDVPTYIDNLSISPINRVHLLTNMREIEEKHNKLSSAFNVLTKVILMSNPLTFIPTLISAVLNTWSIPLQEQLTLYVDQLFNSYQSMIAYEPRIDMKLIDDLP